MTTFRFTAVALLVAAVLGCGAAGGAARAPRADPDTITLPEIRASTAVTAFELVQTLRPGWLRPRAVTYMDRGEVVVYLGRLRLGGAAVLHDQEVTGLTRLEYVDARTATQRWGTGHTGGAIVLHH